MRFDFDGEKFSDRFEAGRALGEKLDEAGYAHRDDAPALCCACR